MQIEIALALEERPKFSKLRKINRQLFNLKKGAMIMYHCLKPLSAKVEGDSW